MGKKLCFLICFVFVFCLSSAVEGATPIDVNNFSFEFDNDGNQIICHIGISEVLAWEQSGSAWVGVDPYCLGDANYDANYLDDEICEYCGSTEGCHCWPATHGICWTYIQATDRTYLYQELDPNDSNAIIAPGRKYTLTYDSMSEIYSGVLDYLSIYSGFFYVQEEANHVDIISTSYVLPVWIGEYNEPGHKWTYDLTMEWVCPPGHPDINEVLGFKFWSPSPGGSVRAYAQVDNIRLEWSWATEAFDPYPADRAEDVPRDVELHWSPGLWAANTSGHIVYFSDDFSAVNNLLGAANQGIRDVNDWSVLDYDSNGLDLAKTYYWRIVEVNAGYVAEPGLSDPPWVGDVWSFTVTGYATNPRPADGATDESLYSVLKWEPGTDSEEHDIYFGTDFDEVNEADDSDANVFKGTHIYSANSYDPGILDLGRRYYWRIDEVRNNGADVIKGHVWHFTVAKYLMIDDMESYGSGVSTITNTWLDYWENGSTAQIWRETDDANYIRDDQSMKYKFENSDAPYYAEISREFSPAQDWTVAGFKVLALYFRADFYNDESAIQPMYVFVSDGTDTGTVEYDDPNDLIRGWMGWQVWNIELQDFADAGVELTNVTEMGIVIGDGNEAGDGDVYFDDIRLYPTRCVVKEATGSFTNDCDIDGYDLAALARDWLVSGIGSVSATVPSDANLYGYWTMNDNNSASVVLDSSGEENHGVFYDDVDDNNEPVEGATVYYSITPGAVDDYALKFDGYDDYVKLPALNESSNTITITAWIKREFVGNIYEGIVFSSNAWAPEGETAPDPNYTAGLQLGADRDTWTANYELSYMWTGYSWEWYSGLFVPPEEWTFTALTVAPDVATLYVSDGISLQASRKYDTHEALPWETTFHIADQMQFGPLIEEKEPDRRFFHGAIDEVRIYNRTLTPNEIASLAGVSSAELGLEPWRVDANEDDIVNFPDFVVIADNWLTEVLWP